MMNVIFTVMILFSVACGIVTGKSAEVSDAAINSCVEAVELFSLSHRRNVYVGWTYEGRRKIISDR